MRKMVTSRNDIERDKKQVTLPYSERLSMGYSRCTLKFGDCFLYKEHGTKSECLARSHGRIRPHGSRKWFILAQRANTMMSFTCERWVSPKDVIEIRPEKHCKKSILDFFDGQIELNGY